ncbi:MAG TPA: DNA mismatch endonuclease Vsr [Candidatus Caccoplasma intestinavium]|mgnify:FL=1|uniref:Very short patch repair endonuclease n=1 Tax=Candidatus Caccoplasma intestinavium TaxID=2840716 RepID=A0A9D1KDY7_9BACT|nr:DNA mismatch endonuclease Vsr [Candidatus Caccoplasma intestinavium]
MADTVSKEKRSEIMSHVTGKETKPEIIVRKYLFARGLRYRKNVKRLPGTPDIVFPKYKTAVFVNGCFWHGHKGCKYSHLPSTNFEYWEKKIADNIERDERKKRELEGLGYRVLIIWQCQLKSNTKIETLEALYHNIANS